MYALAGLPWSVGGDVAPQRGTSATGFEPIDRRRIGERLDLDPTAGRVAEEEAADGDPRNPRGRALDPRLGAETFVPHIHIIDDDREQNAVSDWLRGGLPAREDEPDRGVPGDSVDLRPALIVDQRKAEDVDVESDASLQVLVGDKCDGRVRLFAVVASLLLQSFCDE